MTHPPLDLAEIERLIIESDKKMYVLRGKAHDWAQTERADLIKMAKQMRQIDDIRKAVKLAGEARRFQKWSLK